MFLGHFGIALAAKKAAPKTSLAVLVAAGECLDLIWPVLLILGVEHVRVVKGITAVTPFDFYDYPISHSLLTALIWGGLAAALYFAFTRYTRGAWLIAALVPSHWVLDWLVHRPDMPLWPGHSPKFGLGIWNSWPLTLAAEFAIFGVGLFLYLSSTRSKNRLGRYLIWLWAAVLVGSWLSTITSEPPSASAIAWLTLSLWLLVAWAGWADSNRTSSWNNLGD
jgi:hypothetical protein